MRASPSIVPGGIDRDVYLVLDDFGLGCAWRETNVEDTDLERFVGRPVQEPGVRHWL